ncbi:MAG TPA: arginase family protein [Thermoanaerobaculia bacterium]
MRQISLLDAPTDLGLRRPDPLHPVGCIRLPAALRAHGLAERLSARDEGSIPVPPYDPRKDKELGVLNPRAIAVFTVSLANHLTAILDARRFPIVLGGDCSVALGSLLALRRRGRYGLLFMDGHTDFYTPETSGTGGVAGMDLAIACGRGPELLTNLEGRGPLVCESDVVLFGHRDLEESQTYGGTVDGTAITDWPLDAIRERGLYDATRSALMRLAVLDGFWIHIDADVLDDDEMPAVDSRQPGGMRLTELTEILKYALASPKCVGMNVAIFDADQDGDGAIAKRFADALVAAFG